MSFHTLNELKQFFHQFPAFAFYGLGNIGTMLYSYLEVVGLTERLQFYILTAAEEVPERFLDKPIRLITTLSEQERDIPIFIAATGMARDEIGEMLAQMGVRSYFAASDEVFQNAKSKIFQQSLQTVAENTVVQALSSVQEEKSRTDILFISPPYWDVYSPFSAVPSLMGRMKQQGIAAVQVDLGIAAFRYLLTHIWKPTAYRLMGYGFYQKEVCRYKDNPYPTYKSYYNALWFFKKEEFPLDAVKAEYENLNDVQRGVINLFYQALLELDEKNVNFNTLDCIQDALELGSWDILYSVLLSDKEQRRLENLPNIVGVSVTSTRQFLPACRLAGIIRKVKPGVKLLLGGSCSDLFVESLYPSKREIFNYFDYVIVGEGETAVWKLCRYLQGDNVPLDTIPNLVYINNNHQVSHGERLLEDVETLPLADYRGLDLDEYVAPRPILPYQASRGCHYGQCAFCNHNEWYRHNYRMKSSAKVVREIVQLSEKYGVYDIQFVDEAIRPDHFAAIIGEMEQAESYHDIHWFYYSRVSRQYTADLLIRAYQCGCRMVMFGVETFNQRLLGFIRKGITADTARYCLKLFHENRIMTYAWLMSNLPSETVEEVREDMAEVECNIANIDAASVGPFLLEFNTDMYHEPQQFNIISKDLEHPECFASHHEGEIIDKDAMLACYHKEYVPLLCKYFFYRDRYQVYFGIAKEADGGKREKT